jgi:hypothetical protein
MKVRAGRNGEKETHKRNESNVRKKSNASDLNLIHLPSGPPAPRTIPIATKFGIIRILTNLIKPDKFLIDVINDFNFMEVSEIVFICRAARVDT